MKVSFSSFSVQGRERSNQDAILEPVEIGSGFWCAIADGVGGRPDGDVASALAVNSIRTYLSSAGNAAMAKVFAEVEDQFEKHPVPVENEKPMATTLSVLNFSGKSAHVGHIGDTRIYHLRNEGILRRTKDQTEVQDLLDRGVINKRQAPRYQRKNVLNGYISSGKKLLLAESSFEIENDDRIVLLTDGVYGVVSMKLVRDISVASATVTVFAEKLQAAVEEAGIVDDYSALVLSVET